jgi:hypothetical protein
MPPNYFPFCERLEKLQAIKRPFIIKFNNSQYGAENGIRTRDPRLGKAMLYH